MEYLLYLLHIVQQNLLVYLIFVKNIKKYYSILKLCILYLMILKKKCFLQLLCTLQQNLVLYLMVYLRIFKKSGLFYPLFILFTNSICVVRKKQNEKDCFLLYLIQQDYVIHI